jgi:hypothetical protein
VDAERAGIDRRELIKRGAIAGGLIWTAPVVMSLSDKAAGQTLGGSPCTCDPGKYWVAKLDGADASATCTSVPDNSQDCASVTQWLDEAGAAHNGTAAACAQLTRTNTSFNGWGVVEVTVPVGCKIVGACAKYGGQDPCSVAPVNDRTVRFFLKSGNNPVGQCGGAGGGDGGTGLSHYEVAWCCC